MNCHYLSIYILKQDGLTLFSDKDRILNLIREFLVIVIVQNTIPPI